MSVSWSLRQAITQLRPGSEPFSIELSSGAERAAATESSSRQPFGPIREAVFCTVVYYHRKTKPLPAPDGSRPAALESRGSWWRWPCRKNAGQMQPRGCTSQWPARKHQQIQAFSWGPSSPAFSKRRVVRERVYMDGPPLELGDRCGPASTTSGEILRVNSSHSSWE